MLVLEDESGNLSFLVHPRLRSIVTGGDFFYIESLLEDFVERAKLHPEELFKQLSSLGVGPLVTKDTGANISDHNQLLELCSHFQRL